MATVPHPPSPSPSYLQSAGDANFIIQRDKLRQVAHLGHILRYFHGNHRHQPPGCNRLMQFVRKVLKQASEADGALGRLSTEPKADGHENHWANQTVSGGQPTHPHGQHTTNTQSTHAPVAGHVSPRHPSHPIHQYLSEFLFQRYGIVLIYQKPYKEALLGLVKSPGFLGVTMLVMDHVIQDLTMDQQNRWDSCPNGNSRVQFKVKVAGNSRQAIPEYAIFDEKAPLEIIEDLDARNGSPALPTRGAVKLQRGRGRPRIGLSAAAGSREGAGQAGATERVTISMNTTYSFLISNVFEQVYQVIGNKTEEVEDKINLKENGCIPDAVDPDVAEPVSPARLGEDDKMPPPPPAEPPLHEPDGTHTPTLQHTTRQGFIPIVAPRDSYPKKGTDVVCNYKVRSRFRPGDGEVQSKSSQYFTVQDVQYIGNMYVLQIRAFKCSEIVVRDQETNLVHLSFCPPHEQLSSDFCSFVSGRSLDLVREGDISRASVAQLLRQGLAKAGQFLTAIAVQGASGIDINKDVFDTVEREGLELKGGTGRAEELTGGFLSKVPSSNALQLDQQELGKGPSQRGIVAPKALQDILQGWGGSGVGPDATHPLGFAQNLGKPFNRDMLRSFLQQYIVSGVLYVNHVAIEMSQPDQPAATPGGQAPLSPSAPTPPPTAPAPPTLDQSAGASTLSKDKSAEHGVPPAHGQGVRQRLRVQMSPMGAASAGLRAPRLTRGSTRDASPQAEARTKLHDVKQGLADGGGQKVLADRDSVRGVVGKRSTRSGRALDLAVNTLESTSVKQGSVRVDDMVSDSISQPTLVAVGGAKVRPNESVASVAPADQTSLPCSPKDQNVTLPPVPMSPGLCFVSPTDKRNRDPFAPEINGGSDGGGGGCGGGCGGGGGGSGVGSGVELFPGWGLCGKFGEQDVIVLQACVEKMVDIITKGIGKATVSHQQAPCQKVQQGERADTREPQAGVVQSVPARDTSHKPEPDVQANTAIQIKSHPVLDTQPPSSNVQAVPTPTPSQHDEQTGSQWAAIPPAATKWTPIQARLPLHIEDDQNIGERMLNKGSHSPLAQHQVTNQQSGGSRAGRGRGRARGRPRLPVEGQGGMGAREGGSVEQVCLVSEQNVVDQPTVNQIEQVQQRVHRSEGQGRAQLQSSAGVRFAPSAGAGGRADVNDNGVTYSSPPPPTLPYAVQPAPAPPHVRLPYQHTIETARLCASILPDGRIQVSDAERLYSVQHRRQACKAALRRSKAGKHSQTHSLTAGSGLVFCPAVVHGEKGKLVGLWGWKDKEEMEGEGEGLRGVAFGDGEMAGWKRTGYRAMGQSKMSAEQVAQDRAKPGQKGVGTVKQVAGQKGQQRSPGLVSSLQGQGGAVVQSKGNALSNTRQSQQHDQVGMVNGVQHVGVEQQGSGDVVASGADQSEKGTNSGSKKEKQGGLKEAHDNGKQESERQLLEYFINNQDPRKQGSKQQQGQAQHQQSSVVACTSAPLSSSTAQPGQQQAQAVPICRPVPCKPALVDSIGNLALGPVQPSAPNMLKHSSIALATGQTREKHSSVALPSSQQVRNEQRADKQTGKGVPLVTATTGPGATQTRTEGFKAVQSQTIGSGQKGEQLPLAQSPLSTKHNTQKHSSLALPVPFKGAGPSGAVPGTASKPAPSQPPLVAKPQTISKPLLATKPIPPGQKGGNPPRGADGVTAPSSVPPTPPAYGGDKKGVVVAGGGDKAGPQASNPQAADQQGKQDQGQPARVTLPHNKPLVVAKPADTGHASPKQPRRYSLQLSPVLDDRFLQQSKEQQRPVGQGRVQSTECVEGGNVERGAIRKKGGIWRDIVSGLPGGGGAGSSGVAGGGVKQRQPASKQHKKDQSVAGVGQETAGEGRAGVQRQQGGTGPGGSAGKERGGAVGGKAEVLDATHIQNENSKGSGVEKGTVVEKGGVLATRGIGAVVQGRSKVNGAEGNHATEQQQAGQQSGDVEVIDVEDDSETQLQSNNERVAAIDIGINVPAPVFTYSDSDQEQGTKTKQPEHARPPHTSPTQPQHINQAQPIIDNITAAEPRAAASRPPAAAGGDMSYRTKRKGVYSQGTGEDGGEARAKAPKSGAVVDNSTRRRGKRVTAAYSQQQRLLQQASGGGKLVTGAPDPKSGAPHAGSGSPVTSKPPVPQYSNAQSPVDCTLSSKQVGSQIHATVSRVTPGGTSTLDNVMLTSKHLVSPPLTTTPTNAHLFPTAQHLPNTPNLLDMAKNNIFWYQALLRQNQSMLAHQSLNHLLPYPNLLNNPAYTPNAKFNNTLQPPAGTPSLLAPLPNLGHHNPIAQGLTAAGLSTHQPDIASGVQSIFPTLPWADKDSALHQKRADQGTEGPVVQEPAGHRQSGGAAEHGEKRKREDDGGAVKPPTIASSDTPHVSAASTAQPSSSQPVFPFQLQNDAEEVQRTLTKINESILQEYEDTKCLHCKVCVNMKFSSKMDLVQHLKSKTHRKAFDSIYAAATQDSLPPGVELRSSSELGGSIYYCGVCQKELHGRVTMRQHVSGKKHREKVKAEGGG